MKSFKCVLCGESGYESTSDHTRDFKDQIVRCLSCQHVQMFPIPSLATEKEFYAKDKQARLIKTHINFENLKKRSEYDNARRAEEIAKKFSPSDHILDIGSGYGFFLRAMESKGFKNLTGFDISPARLKIAKKFTRASLLGKTIKSSNKTGKRYGAVTMFHVLEHLRNPIELCSFLTTYLRTNGTLIIEVPNADDSMLNFSKEYRKFFWQRAHISYFTARTVKKILKESGYSKVKIKGIQRYSFENALNWFKFQKPEISDPTYETTDKLIWLENFYKKTRTENLKCDTLWIEAKV